MKKKLLFFLLVTSFVTNAQFWTEKQVDLLHQQDL